MGECRLSEVSYGKYVVFLEGPDANTWAQVTRSSPSSGFTVLDGERTVRWSSYNPKVRWYDSLPPGWAELKPAQPTGKPSEQLKKLLRAHVDSQIALSWLGNMAPDSWDEVRRRAKEAKRKLYHHLAELENAKKEEPSASRDGS